MKNRFKHLWQKYLGCRTEVKGEKLAEQLQLVVYREDVMAKGGNGGRAIRLRLTQKVFEKSRSKRMVNKQTFWKNKWRGKMRRRRECRNSQ